MMLAISTEGLSKRFGNTKVLHGIDLKVTAGNLVGFLGPNGAGKSTTIRILLGLIRATSGSAIVLGQNVLKRGHSVRNRIGYLPGEVNLYKSLSGLATIQYLCRVRKLACLTRAQELSEMLQLDLNVRVGKYSSGMKQKLGLILAMMHDTALLILDEPTSALDPLVKRTVFDLLRDFSRRGKTILFSSHSLNEVEDFCDEVIILRAGQIVEQQSISRLKELALRRVMLKLKGEASTHLDPQFNLRRKNGREVHGTWSGSPESLIDFLKKSDVENFVVERPDLEDLFITYYAISDAKHSSTDGANEQDPIGPAMLPESNRENQDD